ncbi:glycerophosphoryl diester phosphodiesterase [Spirochaetia bacterium]|nr:glycerophosphoryl diester phosphodiesterase [Spirochaetia bacterium]
MKILNLAHRGFSGKYPENTKRAFMAAIQETPCHGFESDVHLSSDGEPVIIHDDVLDRTTNATGPVGKRSFRELRELDCGSWKGSEFAGEQIMHLDELLALVIEHNLFLNLEIKNNEVFYQGIEKTVINRIKACKAEERVLLSSFNHPSMLICKEIEPKIKTGLLYGQPMIAADEYARSYGMDAIHPGINCLEYSPELVGKCHEKGLQVNTWTVNTEENIRFCIQLGVDSIISNYPDKVALILGAPPL